MKTFENHPVKLPYPIPVEECKPWHGYALIGRGPLAGIKIPQPEHEFIGLDEHLGIFSVSRFINVSKVESLGTVEPIINLGKVPIEFQNLNLEDLLSKKEPETKQECLNLMILLANLSIKSTEILAEIDGQDSIYIEMMKEARSGLEELKQSFQEGTVSKFQSDYTNIIRKVSG